MYQPVDDPKSSLYVFSIYSSAAFILIWYPLIKVIRICGLLWGRLQYGLTWSITFNYHYLFIFIQYLSLSVYLITITIILSYGFHKSIASGDNIAWCAVKTTALFVFPRTHVPNCRLYLPVLPLYLKYTVSPISDYYINIIFMVLYI